VTRPGSARAHCVRRPRGELSAGHCWGPRNHHFASRALASILGKADPLRIVFAGTPEAAVPSLRALLDSRHQVAAVITRPDARRGRGRTLSRSPVGELADTAEIPVLTPESARAPEFSEKLGALRPDAAVVVAYGALLPGPVLAVPTHGWVNLHFSLLPAWRGAAPVQAAIRAGDQVTGASTFRLEEGMDTGPVYGVVTETIHPRDTAGELLGRLSESGAALLVATLDGIEDGTLAAKTQPAEGVSYAGKVTVADAEIDWSVPAFAVDRTIRSVTPAPGAWTGSPWGRLVIGPVEATDEQGLAAGELSIGRKEVLVGTGTTAVRLGSLTPSGRRPMPAGDWARGVRPESGQVLR
jgi:methionyl-tRNA formyltransferase